MGFTMPAIPVIIGIVCAAVGLIFQIVGVATPGWIVWNNAGQGLWETCGNNVCIDFPDDVPDFLEACRAFGIIGLLVLAACLVVGILICFIQMDKMPIIAAILGFVAAVCILIEFAVYAGETDVGKGFDYGYSFALTIVAFILSLAAGICFIVGKA